MSFLESYFAYPWLLLSLVLLPALALAWWWRERRRDRALLVLTGGHAAPSQGALRRRLGTACWFSLLILLMVGSAGPQWGRDPSVPPSRGRDLIVVLDVSRSMLAEYPPRSRLQRAKRYLYDLVDSLQRQGGYRVGLVMFAGQAKVLCPLTADYDQFRFAVGEAHPDRLGPVGRISPEGAGTQIGNALELAVAQFDPAGKGFQEILLVSDGDDLATDRQRGVNAALLAGITVHALAVGNPQEPVPIPDGTGYLMFQGERVKTQRHDEILQQIARETGGVFQPEERPQPLVSWFQANIKPLPVREWTEDQRPLHEQRYASFFAAALLLLVGEMMIRNLLLRVPRLPVGVIESLKKRLAWLRRRARAAVPLGEGV